MTIEIALYELHDPSRIFAIARSADPTACLAMTPEAARLISSHLAGIPLVLCHIDVLADLRTFGRHDLTRGLVGIDLSELLWAELDV